MPMKKSSSIICSRCGFWRLLVPANPTGLVASLGQDSVVGFVKGDSCFTRDQGHTISKGGGTSRRGTYTHTCRQEEADVEHRRADAKACSLRISSRHLSTLRCATRRPGRRPATTVGVAAPSEGAAGCVWRRREDGGRDGAASTAANGREAVKGEKKLSSTLTSAQWCARQAATTVGHSAVRPLMTTGLRAATPELDGGWGCAQREGGTRLFCSAGERPELVEIGEASSQRRTAASGRTPVGCLDNDGGCRKRAKQAEETADASRVAGGYDSCVSWCRPRRGAGRRRGLGLLGAEAGGPVSRPSELSWQRHGCCETRSSCWLLAQPLRASRWSRPAPDLVQVQLSSTTARFRQGPPLALGSPFCSPCSTAMHTPLVAQRRPAQSRVNPGPLARPGSRMPHWAALS